MLLTPQLFAHRLPRCCSPLTCLPRARQDVARPFACLSIACQSAAHPAPVCPLPARVLLTPHRLPRACQDAAHPSPVSHSKACSSPHSVGTARRRPAVAVWPALSKAWARRRTVAHKDWADGASAGHCWKALFWHARFAMPRRSATLQAPGPVGQFCTQQRVVLPCALCRAPPQCNMENIRPVGPRLDSSVPSKASTRDRV